MIVKKSDEVTSDKVEVDGAKNVSIRWLIGKNVPDANFYLRQLEVEPGGHTPFHSHEWEHEIFILEGQGRLNTSNGKSVPLEPGHFAMVSPGEEHQFENTGDTVLKFLCAIPPHGK
jgi:quercetin dioxygenase-like cupin family protein